MFIKKLTVISAVSLMLTMSVAHAHDASMHKKKNAEKPQCDAMKNMDHAKMDMNDPIMQAMMQQCTTTDNTENGDDSSKSKQDEHEGTGHLKDSKTKS